MTDNKLEKQTQNQKNDIIVSLTSYPARINTVHITIKSILNQSQKADKVILWLAPEQFPNKEKDLPKELLALTSDGLTIDWYKDVRSYKKLIPTLKLYSNDIIITADDDVIYEHDWLERLYISYEKNKDAIHCHRAHKIALKNNKILPYSKWIWINNIKNNNSSYMMFFTGIGGVLYPPKCLHEDVLNEDKFTELCPMGDDIWFWGMAVLNNTPIKLVDNAIKCPTLIDGTQETALWKENVINNKNDIQIKNMISAYPEILKKLKIEKKQVFYRKIENIMKSYLLFPYYLYKLNKIKKKFNN